MTATAETFTLNDDPQLPAPEDPTPRTAPIRLTVRGDAVVAHDDFYSDRIRCDHPSVDDPRALGRALIEQARARARGRVVVLAPARLGEGFLEAGLEMEAQVPGFYAGEEDCAVLGYWLDPERASLADPEQVARVQRLVRRPELATTNRLLPDTEAATADDAPAIARLIADTFEQYPTPSGVPEYLAGQIEEGTPFRLVREGGDVVACASADLVRDALTAELTDCATRPDHRGRGYMQALLSDLMEDLRAMDYTSAFTLARAAVPGINLAFLRLGFELHGTMVQSCRIGGGIEDMNIWSQML